MIWNKGFRMAAPESTYDGRTRTGYLNPWDGKVLSLRTWDGRSSTG